MIVPGRARQGTQDRREPSRRRRRRWPRSTEYIAYFGTYSLDDRAKTVTHHRAGSVQPNDTKDLVRGYRFVGNRLILQPPGTNYEVMWERIT